MAFTTVGWVCDSTVRLMTALSPAGPESAWRSSRRSTATETGVDALPVDHAGIFSSARSRLAGRVPVARPVSATMVTSDMACFP